MKKIAGVLITAVLACFAMGVFADEVVFEPYMFDDMDGTEYYYHSVEYMLDKGIMTGTGDNRFVPEETVSKAQLLTMLWNLSDCPEATVASAETESWYQKAASWGTESGVYPYETDFLEQPLTRSEFDVILYRYAEYRDFDMQTSGDLQQFFDAELLNETEYQAMNWMVEREIMSGYPDQTLKGEQLVTRGESAVLLERFCRLLPELPDARSYVKADTVNTVVMDTQLGNFWLKVGDISASSPIERVIAVTWCADDQSDMTWCELPLQEDGSYGGLIQSKDHQFHFGNYRATVYVHLKNGLQIPAASVSVQLDGEESQARVWTQVYRIYEQVGWDLYSCYNWTANNIAYTELPIPLTPPSGYDASEWYAVQAFENRQGNCYCYAAAFYYLAKGLGYDAHFIQGQVGMAAGGYGPHGWVIIDMNGASYICDPEAQHSIGRYNFYMQPVGSPILRYRWG